MQTQFEEKGSKNCKQWGVRKKGSVAEFPHLMYDTGKRPKAADSRN